MNETLFNEFENTSSKHWKQKIQVDLKGADYNDTLIWRTNEGIDVKPFYHADEFEESPKTSSNPTQWKIAQTIVVLEVVEANTEALQAISKGAESIIFILKNESVVLEKLLNNIDLNVIEIHLKPEFFSESLAEQVEANYNEAGIHIHSDIIGNLAKSGNWFANLKEDHAIFEAIVKQTNHLSVNTSQYQNAGANMVQQLAYALAHTNEYLNHLENLNLENWSLSQIEVTFNMSVGTNYFFEIAKLRTLRLLWQTLASEYNIQSDCHIIATPTKRNKTLYDYNTNMLRTTTECMSAILGGANTISNLSYDVIYHKSNEFGDRIARNQLLILKHESYFNKVNNPSDGAYYIETITQQLAEKALELLKDIEANGGFLKQLKEGTIQRKIKESANKEQEQFKYQEEILLGTNKHPNPNDKMKHELELDPFVRFNPRKTLIEPIIEKRLAETIEQERLKTE